jgi:hypothetical protein
MLKSSLIAACLLGLVAFTTNVAIADDAKPAAPNAKPDAPKVGCTRDTGSRLRRNTDGCAGVGSSYTREHMLQTGEPDAGGALRQLDPSITSR